MGPSQALERPLKGIHFGGYVPAARQIYPSTEAPRSSQDCTQYERKVSQHCSKKLQHAPKSAQAGPRKHEIGIPLASFWEDVSAFVALGLPPHASWPLVSCGYNAHSYLESALSDAGPRDALGHFGPPQSGPVGPERSSYSSSSVLLFTPSSPSTSGALSQGPDKAPREAQEESTRSHASALLGAHVGALLRPSRGPPMSQRAPIGLQEWPKEGSRRARDYGLRPSLPPCLSRGSAWS